MEKSDIQMESKLNSEIKVLIVDDNRNNLNLITNYLEGSGFSLLVATSAEIALKRIDYALPDIILLDIMMPPGENGYEVCAKLKKSNRTKDIPIIFMTSLTDVDDKVKAFELGAADYITKPIQSEELLARINTHLKSYKYQELLEKEVEKRTNDLLIANSRLLKSEESLAMGQRVSRTGSWDWNLADDSLTWSNETFRQLGLNPTETTPTYELFRKFVHPDDLKIVEDAVNKALQGEEPYSVEARMFRKDGSEWVMHSQGIVTKNNAGKIIRFVGTQQDITDIKRAEQKSEELANRLQQAQKMESIGNLAGGIAHDFNNLLCPIIGMSELLLDSLPPESLEYENAQAIFNAGNRAGELAGQILTFSRRSEHKMSPVRIQNVLKEVLKLSRSIIPKDIEIHQNIQAGCPSIIADASQIHQVVMNLMTNAYHAVQETSGRISVTLEQITLDKNELANKTLERGECVVLTVSDTGTGIEASILDKIFEPYFTTKKHGKGTGLGLAVVFGIIKEHEGDIKVYSEIGKGTTVKVYLPLMIKSDGPISFEQIPKVETGTERILLVDDEEPITKYLNQMLSRLGYRVTDQVKSLEALEVFKANPENFDLVITDMAMPDMTGDQLSEKILSIKPDIPIIIFTGNNDRINKEHIKQLGVKGFLMKPATKSEVAQMVRKVLNDAKV